MRDSANVHNMLRCLRWWVDKEIKISKSDKLLIDMQKEEWVVDAHAICKSRERNAAEAVKQPECVGNELILFEIGKAKALPCSAFEVSIYRTDQETEEYTSHQNPFVKLLQNHILGTISLRRSSEAGVPTCWLHMTYTQTSFLSK